MEQREKTLWDKAAAFHGHRCGGLAIGFQASLYVMKLLNTDFSVDEGLVCIAENDNCSVDAIQALLGCSVGKGNLLFHIRGKQAFSFYHRDTGKSFRLVLKAEHAAVPREKSMAHFLEHTPEELFEVREATLALPQKARLFESYCCAKCHEQTGAAWIRIVNGEKLCLDCAGKYNRFDV